MRTQHVLPAVLIALALPASAALAQQGIPAPPFNPATPAGYTHYVDNSVAAATDTSNPKGTPAKPRRTIPTTLAAGSIVEVRGGPYNVPGSDLKITAQGTATAPVVIKGVGKPLMQGVYDATVVLLGSYGVWEGFRHDYLAVTVPGDHWVFRNNEVRNFNPGTNASSVSTYGRFVVLASNWIHHNGNSENTQEIDIHGILVIPGALGVWILDNEISHNGGDGIQVGQYPSAEPWAQGVFIARNKIHEDRENGVDIKQSRDVVLLSNAIYGYRERSSSAGEAVVAHGLAERVWILNNFVAASVRGIVSTGTSVYVVAGNLVHSIRHNPANTYDPNSLFSAFGIHTRNSSNVYHVNNTVWASDGGISVPPGNAGDAVVANNLVSTSAIGIGGRFTQSAANWDVKVNGDPKLVNPTGWDFRLRTGSPLLNTGTASNLLASYGALYGAPLTTDVYGGVRPVGALDIGVAEGAVAP